LESLALDAYRIGNYPWPDPNGPRQVLDIGAHVGSFTCSLAAVLPGATFTCVEPSVQTSEWLSKNLERNNLSGRATVLSVAVSDVDGPIDYWYDDAVSGENSLEKGTRHHKILVDGLSISSIFALMTKPPDIVKLDCEGGEYASILGGSSELYKSTNHVFLEYHPIEGHSFQELLHRLEEFGLHLEWHETGHIRDQGMAYFTRRK